MRIIVAVIGFAGALAFSSAAFADTSPYLDRYKDLSSNPNPDAQCDTQAGSGGFGYWGKDFNRGIQNPDQHPDRGAGTDHGFNNAGICGNPPDSAPPS